MKHLATRLTSVTVTDPSNIFELMCIDDWGLYASGSVCLKTIEDDYTCAYAGDWVVRGKEGKVQVMTNQEFQKFKEDKIVILEIKEEK